MKVKEAVGQVVRGSLNGVLGMVIKAVNPKPGSQGGGFDCLVRWGSFDDPKAKNTLEDSWEDAGNLDFPIPLEDAVVGETYWIDPKKLKGVKTSFGKIKKGPYEVLDQNGDKTIICSIHDGVAFEVSSRIEAV